MKRIKNAFAVAAMAAVMMVGSSVVALAAVNTTPYYCPANNSACITNGACVGGTTCYVCPDNNAACVENGACIGGSPCYTTGYTTTGTGTYSTTSYRTGGAHHNSTSGGTYTNHNGGHGGCRR